MCRHWAESGAEPWTAAADWYWNRVEVGWWAWSRDAAETNGSGAGGRRRAAGRTQLGWHTKR